MVPTGGTRHLTKPPAKATKQSGVGDVRPHASMLWSAPSLQTYVATATRKSKQKSADVNQGEGSSTWEPY
jgi:hypothetical protein